MANSEWRNRRSSNLIVAGHFSSVAIGNLAEPGFVGHGDAPQGHSCRGLKVIIVPEPQRAVHEVRHAEAPKRLPGTLPADCTWIEGSVIGLPLLSPGGTTDNSAGRCEASPGLAKRSFIIKLRRYNRDVSPLRGLGSFLGAGQPRTEVRG